MSAAGALNRAKSGDASTAQRGAPQQDTSAAAASRHHLAWPGIHPFWSHLPLAVLGATLPVDMYEFHKWAVVKVAAVSQSALLGIVRILRMGLDSELSCLGRED